MSVREVLITDYDQESQESAIRVQAQKLQRLL